MFAMIVITLIMVMFIAAPIIAVAIAIPVVIVIDVAAGTFPATRAIIFPVIARRYPGSPFIRWPSPVSLMPLVMASDRIPVAFCK
jgi:hypothetical protein